jgi:hypothetical protein
MMIVRRRLRLVATAAAAMLLLTACEPVIGTPAPVGETRVDCAGVSAAICESSLAEARNGSVVPLAELVVRCSQAPCTDRSGQTTVDARYADGTVSSWGSAWGAAVPAGPPGPPELDPNDLPVEPLCIGIEPVMCREFAASAASGGPVGGPAIRSIRVRCTRGCTPTHGEGETLVTYVDGSVNTSGWGYEGGG